MVLASMANITLLGLSVPKNCKGAWEAMPQPQKHSFTPVSGQINAFLYATSRNHFDSKRQQAVVVPWQVASADPHLAHCKK